MWQRPINFPLFHHEITEGNTNSQMGFSRSPSKSYWGAGATNMMFSSARTVVLGWLAACLAAWLVGGWAGLSGLRCRSKLDGLLCCRASWAGWAGWAWLGWLGSLGSWGRVSWLVGLAWQAVSFQINKGTCWPDGQFFWSGLRRIFDAKVT